MEYRENKIKRHRILTERNKEKRKRREANIHKREKKGEKWKIQNGK